MQTGWMPKTPHEIDDTSGLRGGFEIALRHLDQKKTKG